MIRNEVFISDHPEKRGILGPRRRNPFFTILERSAPKQGWGLYCLLLSALYVVVWTVIEADWVDTPGLLLIVGIGATLAMLLSKAKMPWPVLQIAGLGIGTLIVSWQAASLIPDVGVIEQFWELRERLTVWYRAAITGGISTDLMPFTIMMLTAGWFLGFMSSWFLFRLSNVWVATVLPSIALLTNLSFLPDGFESRFLLFMFFTMLLVARSTLYQSHEHWIKARVDFDADHVWWSLRFAIVLSILVLVIAAVLPLKVFVSRTAAGFWDIARTPVEHVENEFARLFSGVPSRKELAGRFFGKTLPFQGKISFDGDTVLWATSEIQTYWNSRIYSEYSSNGWITGSSDKVRIGPGHAPIPPQESFNRIPIDQNVQVGFDTSNLFSGGNLQWVTRPIEAEILQPKQFEIDMYDLSEDDKFPLEVQGLAKQIRYLVNEAHLVVGESEMDKLPRRVSEISKLLPSDMVIKDILPKYKEPGPSVGSGTPVRIDSLVLARKNPIASDIIAWEFIKDVTINESYSMGSLVTNVTDRDLRESSTNYSGFVKDHYLQLPNSLPTRVVELALQLTAEADTPLDKAFLIQSFLRSDKFEYSQDIDVPPVNSDGVDHFLFETRKGYSDYFASSMVVMLRASGVPSRLAVGYAPGVLDEETGMWSVLDSDSHAWVQVYFSGHGWIDFQPTSKWDIARRSPDTPSQVDRVDLGPSESQINSNLLPGDPCDDPNDPRYVEELCAEEDVSGVIDLAQLLDERAEDSILTEVPVRYIVVGIVSLVGILVLLRWVWARSFLQESHVDRAYSKMGRLGALAGFHRKTQQTPLEYAAGLGSNIPEIGPNALMIAGKFSAGRYGKSEMNEEDLELLTEAWKSVRGALLVRVVKRVSRLGNT